jgi:hypothetical protein
MPIPSSNISMKAINTEVTSVDSHSLETLSNNATAGSDPADGAQYGVKEFSGYTHAVPYPAATSSLVQFASASGTSLYSYKFSTGSGIPPNAAAPKAGFTVRVNTNAYGSYYYVKEAYSSSNSLYRKNGVNYTLSTTEKLMSYSTNTISQISHIKINFTASLLASGPTGFLSNGSTGWIATTGTNFSHSATLYVQASAECFNTSIREATGNVQIYLRGSGFQDTLVAEHDYSAETSATATACE